MCLGELFYHNFYLCILKCMVYADFYKLYNRKKRFQSKKKIRSNYVVQFKFTINPDIVNMVKKKCLGF